MWRLLLKIFLAKVVSDKFSNMRLNAENAAHQAANFAGNRIGFVAANIGLEWQRIIKTIIATIAVIGMLMFSAIVGLVWIVAVAWNSPYRDWILGATLGFPILFSLLCYVVIRKLWKNKPFLHQSRDLITRDIEIFQKGFRQDSF